VFIGDEFEEIVEGVRLIELQLCEVFLVVVGLVALDEGVEVLDDSATYGVDFAVASKAEKARIVQVEFVSGIRVRSGAARSCRWSSSGGDRCP